MSEKCQILFVDDEKSILDGLKRSLRSQRKEWEMTFAVSGPDALQLAEFTRFDVIVSDMRMPQMDGAELLKQFSEKFPDSIRFILSGHSDEDLISKSIPYAHQFLSKPCEVSVIIDKVNRALQYRNTMGEQSVRELISNIKSLPTLPHLYQEVTAKLEDGNASVASIGKLVQQDPAMCAKLLQLVNSSFFGVGRKVVDPVQAATLLGLDTLKNLILSIGIFSQFSSIKLSVGHFTHEALYRHSTKVADVSRLIAKEEGVDNSLLDLYFLSGILHDIGKLILVHEMPEKYEQFYKLIKGGDKSIPEAEFEVFGVDHGKVGAYLLGLWAMPQEVVEAVAFHHDISRIEPGDFSPLVGVHVADSFVSAVSKDVSVLEAPVNESYIESCGLANRLDVWRELYQSYRGGEAS